MLVIFGFDTGDPLKLYVILYEVEGNRLAKIIFPSGLTQLLELPVVMVGLGKAVTITSIRVRPLSHGGVVLET